ncbi:hypothetical protein BDF22DRAFT_148022 [Syncephalis plumigaleata]|nr:hypothetical protein BDF22DRAFT_148022 [Syncephalis plumigaleata]
MIGMLFSRNETLLIVAILALLTNPSEERFQRQLERHLNRQGRHWIESKFLSHATTIAHRRKCPIISLAYSTTGYRCPNSLDDDVLIINKKEIAMLILTEAFHCIITAISTNEVSRLV